MPRGVYFLVYSDMYYVRKVYIFIGTDEPLRAHQSGLIYLWLLIGSQVYIVVVSMSRFLFSSGPMV